MATTILFSNLDNELFVIGDCEILQRSESTRSLHVELHPTGKEPFAIRFLQDS